MLTSDFTPGGNAAAGLVSPPAPQSSKALSPGVTSERLAHYRQIVGLPVILWRLEPTKSGGKMTKVPFGQWMFDSALPLDELQHRLRARSGLELGCATGWRTGCEYNLVIVDCDSPEAEAWARAALPHTPWMARTRSGGLHLGYLYPSIPLSLKIKKTIKYFGKEDKRQLDIIADGGFCAMPPSGGYTWENGEPDMDEMVQFDPSWLPGGEKLLVPRPVRKAPLDGDALQNLRAEMGSPVSPPVLQEARRYAEKLAPLAIQGQAGRDTMFSVCCRLGRDYALSFDQAWEVLSEYNERCVPPFDDQELFQHLEGAVFRGTSDMGSQSTALSLTGYSLAVAPEAAKAVEELNTVRLAALDIPAMAFTNATVVYSDSALTCAAMLKVQDPGAYAVLKMELKKIGKSLDIRDWEKAVKHRVGAVASMLSPATIDDNDRRRIEITAVDDKAIRDDIVDAMSSNNVVYVSKGKIAVLGQDSVLAPLRMGGMRSVLLDLCRFVSVRTDDNGVKSDMPATLPKHILEMLTDIQPAQAEKLRPVDTVSSAPFVWRDEDGAVALHNEPGYHAPTRTLVTSCPVLDLQRFPTGASAVDYLNWLFADFPFESDAEKHNYLAGLLTPLVRPLIAGPVPMLYIEANQQSSGKSFLAQIVQLLYCGFSALETTLPADDAEWKKTLMTMAFKAMPVAGWDNVKGVVSSGSLEAFLTAEKITGRVLSTMDTGTPDVRMMLVLTINNGRTSLDLARRLMRVRLLAKHSVHAHRTYNVPNILTYVKENRAAVLSALARLVIDWVDAGSPTVADLPVLSSFEDWSGVVGGVCHHAGLTAWLTNKNAAQQDLNVNIDETPLIKFWWSDHNTKPVPANVLVQLCGKHLLMGHMLQDKGLLSQSSIMGKWLMSNKDKEIAGYRIRYKCDPHNGSSTYYLEPSV